jgi:hypothetical protein
MPGFMRREVAEADERRHARTGREYREKNFFRSALPEEYDEESPKALAEPTLIQQVRTLIDGQSGSNDSEPRSFSNLIRRQQRNALVLLSTMLVLFIIGGVFSKEVVTYVSITLGIVGLLSWTVIGRDEATRARFKGAFRVLIFVVVAVNVLAICNLIAWAGGSFALSTFLLGAFAVLIKLRII